MECFCEIPMTSELILWLPTVQAGPQNLQEKTQQNIANDGMQNAVLFHWQIFHGISRTFLKRPQLRS